MENTKSFSLTDVLYIFFRWRRFWVINLTIIGFVAIGISFLIPKKYRAITTVVVAPDRMSGLGGISNLLSGSSGLLSLTPRLFGVGGGVSQEDLFLGLMNSRVVLEETIRRFNLLEYYKIKNKKIDLAIKKFRKDFSSDPNEFGIIEVSVVHKNPRIAAEIANFLVHLTDSLNIELNIERARRYRTYIETRYLQNVIDLKKAEEDLAYFQKKYGAFNVPEQIKTAMGVAGKLEMELLINEIELNTLESQFGSLSSASQNVQRKIDALRERLSQLRTKSEKNRESLLLPFNDMPDLQKEYIQRWRDVEIQNKLLEFIYPLYEQAKMEEYKSIPTIMVIDAAQAPQLKYRPKRAAIVVGVVFLMSCFHALVCLRGESLLRKSHLRNPIEQSELKFVKKLFRLYRIRPEK